MRTNHATDGSSARFGFRLDRNSTHVARTIMLSELTLLLEHVVDASAPREDYRQAVLEQNALAKRTAATRNVDWEYLVALYALDPSVTIFRLLRHFWEMDQAGHPLLSLLCGCARDQLLRSTAPFILTVPFGAVVTLDMTMQYVDSLEPGRFSKGTLKSTCQNINASWTKSGHLVGRARKVRSEASPTAGAVAYALALGYLGGIRGELLFESEHVRLLDCTEERAVELAESAARRGWLAFKHIGDVKDVSFPGLLTPEEVEWSRE
ncbi:MAG: hypothetical protein GX600_07880 [Dehalococcoidia bacterium]|nr:hypothetical protein [Dehalococcoidia bacterium]